MATTKLEFSLRLRHDMAGLSLVTQQLALVAKVGWDKGEQNRTIRGSLRDGDRDFSYRCFALGAGTSTELYVSLAECIAKLMPFASVLKSFVNSGGIASLAVGWFSDSAVGGDRIPAKIIADMASLSLTLDLYLYSQLAQSPSGDSTNEF